MYRSRITFAQSVTYRARRCTVDDIKRTLKLDTLLIDFARVDKNIASSVGWPLWRGNAIGA